MRQKNVPQFEAILGEIGQVSVYVPLWIHHGSLTSRCDDVGNVRQSRSKESLDMHQAPFRIDLHCNPLLSENDKRGRLLFLSLMVTNNLRGENLFAEKLRRSFYCMGFAPWKNNTLGVFRKAGSLGYLK